VPDYDVIVAGGGHNGLVCAAYLGRAGQRVAVVERRGAVGGTGDLFPTAGRLQPAVINDLDLAQHGLELIRPAVRMVALREDAPALVFWGDPERTAEELRRHVPADADAFLRFYAHLRLLAAFVAEVQASTPPRLDRAALADAAAGLRLARAYRRYLLRSLAASASLVLPCLTFSASVGSASFSSSIASRIRSAARTARSASSSWMAGTPKTASIASPANFSTVPS